MNGKPAEKKQSVKESIAVRIEVEALPGDLRVCAVVQYRRDRRVTMAHPMPLPRLKEVPFGLS
jgi:hypothetical protein